MWGEKGATATGLELGRDTCFNVATRASLAAGMWGREWDFGGVNLDECCLNVPRSPSGPARTLALLWAIRPDVRARRSDGARDAWEAAQEDHVVAVL